MNVTPFELPADLSEGLLELRDAIATRVREVPELVLDGGRVTRVTTGSLQVLLGAIRAAEQRGIRARWESASPALRSAAARLGLETVLDLPAPAAEAEA